MDGFTQEVFENCQLKVNGFYLKSNQRKKINQILEQLYEISPNGSTLQLELEKRGENYIG